MSDLQAATNASQCSSSNAKQASDVSASHTRQHQDQAWPDALNEQRLRSTLHALGLTDVLSSDAFHSLLQLQQRLSGTWAVAVSSSPATARAAGANDLLTHVCRSLAQEWISEAQLLCQLLSQQHLVNLFSVCDAVAQREERMCDPHPRHEYYNVRARSRSSRSKSRTSFPQDLNPIYQSIDSHLTTCHNHEYDVVDHAFDYDRCTVKTSESKFSVKVIQIVKGQEALGMTVQLVEQDGPVVVSRVLYGGSVYRSGLIAAGDLIFEVNGVPLKGRSQKEVINLLANESKGESICFKLLVPDCQSRTCLSHHYSNNNVQCKADRQVSGVFLKCHFDYNPSVDRQHPCPAVGLAFRKGDILEAVSQEDDDWWQARHEQETEYASSAGIIPSSRLQEQRVAAARDLTRQRYLRQKLELLPGLKSPIRKGRWSHRVRKVMYRLSENEAFEENDLPTYEEVVHLHPSIGFCRPIVLFASELVDRRKLVRRLKQLQPDTFRTPIAHTTRPARDWELDGAEYLFVSRDWLLQEERAGNLIESEQFRGHLYGIHRETVRAVIASGAVCLLSLQSQGLKAVRSPLFKPFVIFLKPQSQAMAQITRCVGNEYECRGTDACSDLLTAASASKLSFKRTLFKSLSECEKHCLLHESAKLEYLYGHYFDVILVVDDDLEDVVSQVMQVIRSVQLVPQWAPASWL